MLQMALRDWIWFEKDMYASEERFPVIYPTGNFNLTAENFEYKSHSSGSFTLPVFTIAKA